MQCVIKAYQIMKEKLYRKRCGASIVFRSRYSGTEYASRKSRFTRSRQFLSSYPRACEYCGKICPYRQVFFAHRKKCNAISYYLDVREKTINEYTCCHCCKTFNRKFNLQKHLESEACLKRKFFGKLGSRYKVMHLKTKSNRFKPEPEQEKSVFGHGSSEDACFTHDPTSEYICAHCGKAFHRRCNLQRHVSKSVCSGEQIVKRCKLTCWHANCSVMFYKQIDLVEHLRRQHGNELAIERLEFDDRRSFVEWKNHESDTKCMNARKLTGAKRSSKGLSYYYVCQFYRKNETGKRKTSRRKTIGVVPNTKCPSRILVKESNEKIFVTYISTHNHDLYDPLEKKPLAKTMASLVRKRHTAGMKLHNETVTMNEDESCSWQITCGSDDKRRTYVVRRVNETCTLTDCIVKCFDERCGDLCEHLYRCTCSKKNVFCKHVHKVHSMTSMDMLYEPDDAPSPDSDPIDELRQNMVKLSEYVDSIPEDLVDYVSATVKALCEKLEKAKARQMFTDPLLPDMDLLRPLLKPYNINTLCLKSLDAWVPAAEIRLLRAADTRFTVGRPYEATVDAFVSAVCRARPRAVVADTRVGRFALENRALPNIWNWYTWSAIDEIIAATCPTPNRWVLLVMKLKDAKICVFDPKPQPMDATEKDCAVVLSCWRDILRNFFGTAEPLVYCEAHATQERSEDSAVYVCWYAYQYVYKGNLTEEVDTYTFRRYIYETLKNTLQTV